MRQWGAPNDGLGADTLAALFALLHAVFGLLMQLTSYIMGLASSPEPIRFGPIDWCLWPLAQLPLVVETGLVVLLWRALHGRTVLRLAFWVIFTGLNFWLCLDQLIFRTFFEHWIPGVVDAPLLMQVLWRNVISQADGFFFAAVATSVALSVVTYQWLFREPSRLIKLVVAPCLKGVRNFRLRLLLIGWLGVTVIVSAQTNYYTLTQYPLVSWIQYHTVDSLSASAPGLPIKVTRSRLARGDVSLPDALDGGLGALGLHTTASGARNIVYLRISGTHATERWLDAISPKSPTLNLLLSTSLTLDQLYRPTSISAGAPQGDLRSLFSQEVFRSRNYIFARANAPDEFSRSGVRNADNSGCELQTESTVNSFAHHLGESQAASRPFFFEAEIDFDWATRSCMPVISKSDESTTNLESLLRGIKAALHGRGVDVATWFVIHIYNDATVVHAMARSVDLREIVTVAAPDQLVAMSYSHRVAYLRDLGADIESLMAAYSVPLKVLGSSFESRNVFFVRDLPQFRWGVRDGPWWFAANLDGTDAALFQLDADPAEKTNLAVTLPKLTDYYQRLTVAWFAQAGPSFGIQPVGFVAAKRGLLPPRYTNVAGPKFVALATAQQTIFSERDTALARINPQDPLVATIFLLPYGESRALQLEWRLPGGVEETYPIVAQAGWTSLWAYPGGSLPMMEGLGRIAVRSDDIVLLAREFLITSAVPPRVAVEHSIRRMQQLQVGNFDLSSAHAAQTFVPREQVFADEDPVVRAVFAAGRGLRLLKLEWIAPSGKVYAQEAGLREEANEIWIKMRTKVQLLEIGTWKVLVKQDAVVLGSGEFAVYPRPVEQGAK